MLVSVAGGTGFVGGYVVRQLLRHEHQVRLLARNPVAAGELRDRSNVELVQGAIDDREAVRRLMAGADAAVNLVGIIEETGRQTFERVHVEGTGNLVRGAEEAGVKKFVYLSALGARPDPDATAYHRSKAAAEAVVRESRLPYLILRPSLIAAPGNEVLAMLLTMLRMSPLVPVIGNGLYRLQPVAAADVGEAVAAGVERESITGTFDIAGPDMLTYHQLLDAMEQALGVQRRRVAVPVPIVRFSAHAGTVLPNLNPITPDQLQMLLEGNTTANNAIQTVFGITPQPFTEVAREIAAPYAAVPATA